MTSDIFAARRTLAAACGRPYRDAPSCSESVRWQPSWEEAARIDRATREADPIRALQQQVERLESRLRALEAA